MARRLRRDVKKEAFWRRMVRGRAGSGLSVRAWCRRHGLRETGFYWWRAELARRDAAAATFMPVRIVEPPPADEGGVGGRIEIVLAGDRQVRVIGPVDRQALTDVLAVLMNSAGGREARAC